VKDLFFYATIKTDSTYYFNTPCFCTKLHSTHKFMTHVQAPVLFKTFLMDSGNILYSERTKAACCLLDI